jgi:hypothetical protein
MKEVITMTYEKLFCEIKKTFTNSSTKDLAGDFAFQFNVIGEGAGAFYAQYTNGKLEVEPFDFQNHTAEFWATAETYQKLSSGKLTFENAIKENLLTIGGNRDRASEAKKLFCGCKERTNVNNYTNAGNIDTIEKQHDRIQNPSSRQQKSHGPSVDSAFSPYNHDTSVSDYVRQ